jgi:hypothetical protein
MDPMTLKLLATAAQLVSGVGGAALEGFSKIDKLTPQEKNRLKELERNQALGLLGLDEAGQQRILNQQLQPIQSLHKEVLQRGRQTQMIDDIGQGAAFRQQAAQQGALQKATIDATDRAQKQIERLDQIEEAKQLSEKRALEKQKQQNRQAAIATFGPAALEGVAGIASLLDMRKEFNTLEEALLEESKKEAEKDAAKALSDDGASEDFLDKASNAMKWYQGARSITGGSSPAASTPAASTSSITPRPTAPAATPTPTGQVPLMSAPLEQTALSLSELFNVPESVAGPISTLLQDGVNYYNASRIENDPLLRELAPKLNTKVNTGETFGYNILEVDETTGEPVKLQWFDSQIPEGYPNLIFDRNNPAHAQHFIDVQKPFVAPSISVPTSTSNIVTLMPRTFTPTTFTHSPGERKLFEVQRASGAGDVYHIISDAPFTINGDIKSKELPGGRYSVTGLRTTSRLGFELDATKPNQVFEAKSVN